MYKPQDHTFVLCAYQENPYVELAIVSLENQSVASNILVSTSTPSDYLRDICARHHLEMVVNPHPHYAGDDWNYGYDSAATRLVTIVHQDDQYDPQFLEATLEAFNQFDNVQIAFTDYYELHGEKRVDDSRLLQVKRMMNRPFRSKMLNGKKFVKRRVLGLGCPICCPAVTLNKALLGPSVFDTNLRDSCDFMTWARLASQPGRFVYIDKPLMGHRIYFGSATTKNLKDNIRTDETYKVLSTLWPRPIAALINKFYSTSEKLNAVD